MKNWYGATLLGAMLATAAYAGMDKVKISPIDAPLTVVIHADKHSAHAGKFAAATNKSMFWRTEITKKGYDVAFTEWMRADHPLEFAKVCMKAAEDAKQSEHVMHLSEFRGAANKDAGLRADIAKAGERAAFLDWLKVHHPESYKTELAKINSGAGN